MAHPFETALVFFSRLYPVQKGRGRFVFVNPWRAVMDAHGHATLRIKSANGDAMNIYADDFIGRMLYFFGDLDPKITNICRLLLREGDTVLDVGANVGIVSILSARLVGKTGCVHAFEPQPEINRLLTLSAADNGFAWLKVHPCAISDHDGKMILMLPGTNYGEASFHRVAEGGIPHETAVISLDSFSRQEGLGPIRLLKVDVEGHEHSVFAGGEKCLSENPPDYILFESNFEEETPVLQRPAVRQLTRHGYRIYDLVPRLGKVGFILCDEDTHPFAQSDDLLAVRPGIELPSTR